MSHTRTLLVDEGVGEVQIKRFLDRISGKSRFENILSIGKTFPGVMDNLLLSKALELKAVVFTRDRVFHNASLASNLRSFCLLADGNIVSKKIEGIPSILPRAHPKAELKPPTRVPDAIEPDSWVDDDRTD